MENEKTKTNPRRLLALWVSEDDHALIKTEAEGCGYDISTLLRLRIFGTFRKMKVISRPSPEIMLLSDIAGKIGAFKANSGKIATQLEKIAGSLDQNKRDLFGLDSCLRLLEPLCGKTLSTMNLIDDAITRSHMTCGMKERV